MRTAEYLEEIRENPEFTRAVLTKIEVEKRSGTVFFCVVTDLVYSAGGVDRLRAISQKYLPQGLRAEIKVSKFVPGAEEVRRKILSLIAAQSPAAAAFLRPEDVEVVSDGYGARFCLDFSAEEKQLLRTDEIVDGVTKELNRSLCGSYTGTVRIVEKDLPAETAEESAAEQAEEAFLPRVFPIAGFEKLDGGEQPEYATCMVDCNGEEENLVVCGKILYVQEKQTGKGKPFFVFQLSDGTARMRVTYFSKQATLEKIRALQAGDSIVCSGANELFNGNLSFNAKRINKGSMPENYVVEERPMKKVPATYHTVLPQPCGDYRQTNLFVQDSLPADLTANQFVVFDLETTGLNNTAVGGLMDSIIEVGAVKIKGGSIVEKFSTFVACEKKLSPEIVRLTGIDDEMLVGAPAIADVIPDFYKFCDGCLLVGHNVTFDYRFIEYYAEKERYSFTQKRYDTMELGRELLQLPNYKLNTLADYFKITFNHHRAFDDALTTAKIFIELIKQRKKLPSY